MSDATPPGHDVVPGTHAEAQAAARRLYQVQRTRESLQKEEVRLKAQLRAYYGDTGRYAAGEHEVLLMPNSVLDDVSFRETYPYSQGNAHLYQVRPQPRVARAVLGDEVYRSFLRSRGELKIQVV